MDCWHSVRDVCKNRANVVAKSVQCRSTFCQNSVKFRSKFGPKSIQNRPNCVSEALLEHLGSLLEPKTGSRTILDDFGRLLGVTLASFVRQKYDHFLDYFFDRILMDFGTRF